MKLVVGLGNPGREYAGTRHNIGYDVIDRLADRLRVASFQKKFAGRFATIQIGAEKVALLKPETYMNLSGQSVQPASAFYGIDVTDLFVICDDLNLPTGKLRIRSKGSDGGQKGLRSIATQLGTSEFSRLRIGIGMNPPGVDAADYVLSRYAGEERATVREAIDRATDAVALWCEAGIEECMNRFN